MAGRRMIEKIVHRVIDECHTECPLAIARHYNIPVVSLPLPHSVRGYMLALDDGSVGIAVNDKIHAWERPLVVAHEIGHYIMHDRTLFLSYNAWPQKYEHREYESDVFAYMLAAHCYDMSVKDLYLIVPRYEDVKDWRALYRLFCRKLKETKKEARKWIKT